MSDTECIEFRLDRTFIDTLNHERDDVPTPVPAHAALPEWYRKLESRHGSGGAGSTTVKLCRPFGDAMKSGYIIPSPLQIQQPRPEADQFFASELIDEIESDADRPLTKNGNSNFLLPDIEINLPWQIKAPPGYRTLVTHPLNRGFLDIKPYSLLLDCEDGFTGISVPCRIMNDQIRMQRSDPLIQVIVFHEDAVLERSEIRNFSNHPETYRAYKRHKRMTKARMDWYRMERWEKKKLSSVGTGPEAGDECRYEYPERTVHFYAEEEHYGVSYSPVRAETAIPDTYEEDLRDNCSLSEELTDRLLRAMELGFVTRMNGPVSIDWTKDELSISSEYSDQVVHEMMDVKLGSKLESRDVSVFSIVEQWVPKTPSDYSILYTEPLNHWQSRYRAYSGLSDVDCYLKKANHPGIIRTSESERVVLPDEMTVGQLLPVHRDGFLTNARVYEN